jgi:tRNA-modifying protein YgfZ
MSSWIDLLNEEINKVSLNNYLLSVTPRTIVKVSGVDAQRYLNGQLTQDVKLIKGQLSLKTCITNAKGQVKFIAWLHVDELTQQYWIDVEQGENEALMARLEQYIIADDVVLEDESESWDVFHIMQPLQEVEKMYRVNTQVRYVSNRRFGREGTDLWFKKGGFKNETNEVVLGLEDVSAFESWVGVLNGVRELAVEVFPQDIGEVSECLNFFKGCYIGQEVISRIRSSGKTPYRWVRWKTDVQPEGVDWSEVRIRGANHEEWGRVAKSVYHPVLRYYQGVALIKRDAAEKQNFDAVGENFTCKLNRI